MTPTRPQIDPQDPPQIGSQTEGKPSRSPGAGDLPRNHLARRRPDPPGTAPEAPGTPPRALPDPSKRPPGLPKRPFRDPLAAAHETPLKRLRKFVRTHQVRWLIMPGIPGMLRVMAPGPFEEALRTLRTVRPGPLYTALVTPPTSTSEAYTEVKKSLKIARSLRPDPFRTCPGRLREA